MNMSYELLVTENFTTEYYKTIAVGKRGSYQYRDYASITKKFMIIGVKCSHSFNMQESRHR